MTEYERVFEAAVALLVERGMTREEAVAEVVDTVARSEIVEITERQETP